MRVLPIALSLVTAYASVNPTRVSRGDEVDLDGRVLATNLAQGCSISLLCDNNPDTCAYSFDSFSFEAQELDDIIMYPASGQTGSFYCFLRYESNQIFGFSFTLDGGTEAVHLNKMPSAGGKFISLEFSSNVPKLCEVQIFGAADSDAGPAPTTPAPTLAPTPSPSLAPTAALKDKYDIKVASQATFVFSSDRTSEEMTATYHVGKDYLDKTVLSFLKVDGGTCTNDIKEGQLKKTGGPIQAGAAGTGETVIAEFKIDLDLPNIVEEGEIWEEKTDSSGEILVCVRADVIEVLETGVEGASDTLDNGATGVSVSFTETIYRIVLTYAQGFTTADVTAVKVVATNEDESANSNYGVTACQCDSSTSTDCAAKPMNQNSVLDICVALDAIADGVVIKSIKTLTLEQDDISVAAISEYDENSLTAVEGYDSKDVLIKTRLISGFFTASAGKSISVSGTIVVKFMNPNSDGRQLASLADLSRDLQANGDVASEEDFSFDIELEAEASAPASGINMSFVGNTVIVAAIVGIGGMM